MRVAFIINPKAGKGMGYEVARRLPRWCAENRLDAEIWPTAEAGHATEMAGIAARSGFEVAVAVGGDGTAREVGMGLLGSETSLAILPIGSGNGLARHLGVYVTPEDAVAALPRLLHRRMDVGYVNKQPFLMALGIGFDAEVAYRFSRGERRGLGEYIRATWQTFLQRQSLEVELEVDGVRYDENLLGLTISNASQYGNDALIAPGASLADGRLILTLVRNVRILQALEAVGGLFSGNLARLPFVEQMTFTEARIRTKTSTFFHLDGEAAGKLTEATVRVEPRALRVLHDTPRF